MKDSEDGVSRLHPRIERERHLTLSAAFDFHGYVVSCPPGRSVVLPDLLYLLSSYAGCLENKTAGWLFWVTHRPPSGSVYGLYLESYKVIPKRNYLGAYE